MSGGRFDYNQYKISQIAEDIESYLETNEYDFSEETLNRFREALPFLKKAAIYTQRIDWLLSGDDGEESFHRRLNTELEKI